MLCTHEFEMWRGEQQWIIEAFDLPGCVTEGVDVADAIESAADLLREMARDAIMGGVSLPSGSFGHDSRNDGMLVIVSVEVKMGEVPKISASEAARMLGVSRSRVTAMLSSGLLDGWREGRNTWVTCDSVEARLRDPRPAGRPKAGESKPGLLSH